jgi:hypothetical protein
VVPPDALDARVAAMGWFRLRSRRGSYLALFALAFQLVVSFGHVHLDGGAPGRASIVAKAVVDPASKHSPAVAHDHCPICALIHLAGTLTPSEAPTFSRLATFGRLLLLAAIQFELPNFQHFPLGARGPPLG